MATYLDPILQATSDAFDKSLESGDVEIFIKEKEERQKKFDALVNQLQVFLDGKTDTELEIWMKDMSIVEDLYEKYFYFEKCMHKRSLGFSLLCTVAKRQGKQKRFFQDFCEDSFVWRGYHFKLFVGQGSFWRILKKKKLFFQNM